MSKHPCGCTLELLHGLVELVVAAEQLSMVARYDEGMSALVKADIVERRDVGAGDEITVREIHLRQPRLPGISRSRSGRRSGCR